MRTRRHSRVIFFVILVAFQTGSYVFAQGGPPIVEPETLLKRSELIGKEIEVDDRARFQFHPNVGYDQVYLKRAPEVVCEIPSSLRPRQPSAQVIKVRGILRRENGRMFIEVTSLDLLPSDLDRFNRGVALSTKTDIDTRMGWVRWAESRVKAFQPKDARREAESVDVALSARAREIETEVIRTESDRPARDLVAHWLGLAERARSRGIPEPEPSAQAHRGFREAIGAARTAAELNGIRTKVEAFFPNGKNPLTSSPDLSKWNAPYRNAPADAYRQAPTNARDALDHRLWADVIQAWIEQRAKDEPKSLISLSEEAARLLPDRPVLASSLLEKGLGQAASGVGALRLSEIDLLANLYREKLKQPDKARTLYQGWLDDQRLKRLSPRDADGRLVLAEQYESLLGDKETAVGLLRAAWEIDPLSKETTDAFRRRGFRKVNEEWVAGTAQSSAVEKKTSATESPQDKPAVAEELTPADRVPAARERGLLRGASREEVRIELASPPNRRNYVASQGQLIEQWIYYQDKATLYISFRLKAGDTTPRVVSYYSLPRSPSDPPSAP